jgi:hypothetical protein
MSLIELYYQIMYDRPNYSEISGKPLGQYLSKSTFFFSCFAHIIPKSGPSTIAVPKDIKKTFLKFNEDNVMLVTPEEHHLIDHGTEEGRAKYEQEYGCSFNVFFEKKERLLEELKMILRG